MLSFLTVPWPTTTAGPTIVCSRPVYSCRSVISWRRGPASFQACATLNHILIIDWFYVDAMEGGTLGPAAWADQEPCETAIMLRNAQHEADRRLIAIVERLGVADLNRVVDIHRGDRIQRERIDRLLLHLFQHQIHHRGQAHAMLSATEVRPPQLDEFFAEGEAPLRAVEFAELGWTEDTVWAS